MFVISKVFVTQSYAFVVDRYRLFYIILYQPKEQM